MKYPLRLKLVNKGFELTFDSSELYQEMMRLWEQCASDINEVDGRLDFEFATLKSRVPAHLEGTDLLRAMGYQISCAVTLELLKLLKGKYLLFHSSAVEINGKAALFVAPSGTGKSTAAKYLSSVEGYRYITDETVVIDPDNGMVYPYPKPLSSVIDDPKATYKVDLPLDELGIKCAIEPVPIGAVFLLDRNSDTTYLDTVSTVDALMQLAPMTSALAELRHGLEKVADLIEVKSKLYKLNYREIHDSSNLIADVNCKFEANRESEKAWAVVTRDLTKCARSRSRDSEKRSFGDEMSYEVLPYDDALLVENVVLVLKDFSIFRLEDLNYLLWLHLNEHGSSEMGSIVKAIEDVLGEHKDSHELISKCLRTLIEKKLVVEYPS